MGSDFSRQICCVICERCKKQEVEEETSETKPILQTSGGTSVYTDTQPSTPVLCDSKRGSDEVQSRSQDRRPSADAAEENMETCSAADPTGITERKEAAWDSVDILVAPADGENKEVKVLTQLDNQQEREQVGNAEGKIKPVPCASDAQPGTHTAQDSKLLVDKEQPDELAEAGSGGSPCAGIAFQDRDIFNFIEITNEAAAGQDYEIKPPGESLIGRNLLLCAVQMAEETETYVSAEHVEEMDRAKLAEIMEMDPSEAMVDSRAELYPASAMPWEYLYPEVEYLEPKNQLSDFLEQETQPSMATAREAENLRSAEPADLSEVLRQSSDGVLCELKDEESRECDAETVASKVEPQPRTTQQTIELPEESLTYVRMPVKQEAEFLNVAPSLPEVLGGSGETEAENAEA